MTSPCRKWRTKEPLDESERGEWKSWLKLNIQETKIMASGPITSWQVDGEIAHPKIWNGRSEIQPQVLDYRITSFLTFTFTSHFHVLEKEMATHSSVLAGRVPGTGEPGGLPSLGSHRVRHDWSDLAAASSVQKREGLSMLPRKAFTVTWVSTMVPACRELVGNIRNPEVSVFFFLMEAIWDSC